MEWFFRRTVPYPIYRRRKSEDATVSQGNPKQAKQNKQSKKPKKPQTLVNFVYSTDMEKLQMICSEHLY